MMELCGLVAETPTSIAWIWKTLILPVLLRSISVLDGDKVVQSFPSRYSTVINPPDTIAA